MKKIKHFSNYYIYQRNAVRKKPQRFFGLKCFVEKFSIFDRLLVFYVADLNTASLHYCMITIEQVIYKK